MQVYTTVRNLFQPQQTAWLCMAQVKQSTFYHCKKRAEEIAEEQNGRLD